MKKVIMEKMQSEDDIVQQREHNMSLMRQRQDFLEKTKVK
jgi:hypothetical protein